MVTGGMTCIKYLLFCFNLLFAISGVAIITVGAIIHTVFHHYSEFVEPSIESAPIILIIAGFIIFLIAFFGCCGAVRENHCMVITFSVMILLIFTLEMIAGVAGYLRKNEVESMLNERLNNSMYDYYSKQEVEKSWDILQHEMKCCGMNGPEDWPKITGNNTLPHTCCPNTQNNGSCTITTINNYKTPCLEKLKKVIMKYASLVTGVAVGIALVQLIGVAFACVLGRSIRKEYETV